MVGVQVTVRAVFRVQCDGPCKGWLSLPDTYTLGAPVTNEELVLCPTAARAAMWSGERKARRAAQCNGWSVRPGMWLCPECRLNPLGIRLPPPGLPDYGELYTRYLQGDRTAAETVEDMAQRNGSGTVE